MPWREPRLAARFLRAPEITHTKIPLSPVGPLPDVFTLQHPVITSLLWACVLMAIFAPLSIRRYQRMGRQPATERPAGPGAA